MSGSVAEQASDGPSDAPRQLVSPATIVHIKQVFGKARHAPQSSSAAVEEWKAVRHQRSSTADARGQGNETSGFFVRPARDPRNSVASAVLASEIVEEPDSYAVEAPAKHIHSGEVVEVEYDSDDSHSGDEYTQYKKNKVSKKVSAVLSAKDVAVTSASLPRRLKSYLSVPTLTSIQRGVLKCSLAYLFASLFTFVPWLSALFAAPFDLEGPVSGAHVIATVATYYNPAKTLGAMIEADMFFLWAAGFAVFTAVGSMATANLLESAGLHSLSHIVIVGVWLMGSMGLVAWSKVKVSNAQFGSACSMVALIITSVICKEGSIHNGVFQLGTISQTLATVALGTVISNIVCFGIWRGSATSKLQGDINKTLESFNTLLDLLCHSFLCEDVEISDEAIKKAADGHRSSFTALKMSLEAAKLELWDYRIQRTLKAYDKVVNSMNRLAQHLNGLRSAVNMEKELDEFRLKQAAAAHRSSAGNEAEEADSDVMTAFQESVGPSLFSLTLTLKRALRDIRTSFIHSRAGEKNLAALRIQDSEAGLQVGVEGLAVLKADVFEALARYKTAHTKAIKRLYRHYPSDLQNEKGFLSEQITPEFDSRPNEEVFLIYFFCFNLEEFAREEATLIDAFTAIREEETALEEENLAYQSKYGPLGHILGSIDFMNVFSAPAHHSGRTHRWAILRQQFLRLMPFASTAKESPFPSRINTAVTSHDVAQTKQNALMGRLCRRLWELVMKFRHPDVLYAVKAGVGCGILGSFAFNHRTRPIFVTWSGNWAMLSYMVVVSTTIGATNFNAFFRIGGTVSGALLAVVAWWALQGHPVFLCIASFLFSIPCFWIITTKPKFATSGRFILLSYNLTALYAYNVRSTDYEVEEIAVHRTVSVLVGTLWGLIVTRYIFPFEARKELRQGISELLVNSAYFYQELVEHIMIGSDTGFQDVKIDLSRSVSHSSSYTGERTPLLQTIRRAPSKEKQFVEMEMHLQVSIFKLGALIDHAKHEPRLKGPFPTSPYAAVLKACQGLIDALHAMRTVATREEFHKTIRRELILTTHEERREVAGNILLFMSLLASDLSLKAPLPPYLPPASEAWKRLTAKIGTLPMVQQRAVRGTSAFLLYYSYALMEKDLIAQLENIGNIFQYLFGVLGDPDGSGAGVEAFEALFDTARYSKTARTGSTANGGSIRSSRSSESDD